MSTLIEHFLKKIKILEENGKEGQGWTMGTLKALERANKWK